MKKKVFGTLLLAGMVLGTGQAAFAAEPVAPEGYKIYNNGDGSLNEDLKKGIDIPVKGTLGPIDNGNENENIPEGDSRWIKVELPTKVLFNTEGNKNEKITSIDYHVTNHSGRPVNVSLGGFTAAEGNKEGAVKALSIKTAEGKPVDLLKPTKGTLLAKLETPKVATKNTYIFKYDGTTDEIKLGKERIEVGYTMNLKFEVLKTDGKPAK